MKKVFFFLLLNVILSFFVSAQNVGIGTVTPAYKLDVAGALHASGNTYIDGALGVGTVNPNYKVQIDNGALAFYNETDTNTWYFYYASGNGIFYLAENGISRFVVDNTGNVGIGTYTPAVKLDVAGSGNYNGNLTVVDDINAGNNVNAKGDVTAHGGGVLYNTLSTTNLKVYSRTAAFSVTNLPAHTLSIEGTVGIAGGYTVAPAVFVGDITTTGGTAGPLYQLQLVTYGATTTGFKVRILNNSNFAITQNITWNIMCIGK